MNPDPLTRDVHEQLRRRVCNLLQCEGWTEYFAVHLNARRAEIVGQIMSASTPLENIPALRMLHAELGVLLKMPLGDLAIADRALEQKRR